MGPAGRRHQDIADQIVIIRVREGNGRFGIPRFTTLSGRRPVTVLPGVELDLDLLNG